MRLRWVLIFLPMLLAIPILATNSNEKISDLNCTTCHINAKEYIKHINGLKYCRSCHGNDVHSMHLINCSRCHGKDPLTAFCHGSPPDITIPHSNCSSCHDTNIIVIHPMSCQYCHKNVIELHRKADIVGGVGNV